MVKVESIKSDEDTSEKLSKITHKNYPKKAWLKEQAEKSYLKNQLSVKVNEEFVSIPKLELASLYDEIGDPKFHARVILNRFKSYDVFHERQTDHKTCFEQMQIFFKMNDMDLHLTKDGENWLLIAEHNLGPNFTMFFAELIRLICLEDSHYFVKSSNDLPNSNYCVLSKFRRKSGN